MSKRKLLFAADEEVSAAIEFLALAQRSLYRAANATSLVTESEEPAAVQITYDARHVAKEIQRQAGFVVRVRDQVRRVS